MGSVLLSLGIGWFVLSLAQSLLVVGVGALLFGVRWGDPVGAGLLVGTVGKN